MGGTKAQLPIGRQVSLPGHFDLPVTLESARPLGKGFECRVRLHDGTLDEAVISEQEAAVLAGSTPDPSSKTPLANADHLRLLVESARIRLAYAHDRQFAVSLSGIRLTTNERYKAIQLGDSYWLYVVWDPLGNPDAAPLMIQNPAKYLDHAKKEVVAARFFDIPAAAIEQAAMKG
jgi:hypothetical protein